MHPRANTSKTTNNAKEEQNKHEDQAAQETKDIDRKASISNGEREGCRYLMCLLIHFAIDRFRETNLLEAPCPPCCRSGIYHVKIRNNDK